jgi:hypothetical protein
MMIKTKKAHFNKRKLLHALSELICLARFVQKEINTRRDQGKFKMR